MTRSQALPDTYSLTIDGHCFSLRQVQYPADLPTLHRWMNTEHVIEQWQLNWSKTELAVYFEKMLADDHQRLYLIYQDNQAIGYSEIYEAYRDRLARYDAVDEDDFGWHLLIGEADKVGRGLLRPLGLLISEFIFRHSNAAKIVGEPDSRVQAYPWVASAFNYDLQRTIVMPEKTASLYYCYRDRFYDSSYYKAWRQESRR